MTKTKKPKPDQMTILNSLSVALRGAQTNPASHCRCLQLSRRSSIPQHHSQFTKLTD